MATKHLRPNNADPMQSVTDSQTVGIGGTIEVPIGYPNISIEVATLSATGPFTPRINVSGSWRPIEEDLYGTTFPRAAWQGNRVVTLVGLPPVGFDISASHTGTGNCTFTAWR